MHRNTWADASAEPVVERPDLQIDRLRRAEGALDQGQALVCGDGAGIVEGGGGQAGADNVDAVQRHLGGDRLGLAGDGEAVVGDRQIEVLGHLVPIQRGADLQRDFRRPAQRLMPAFDRRPDSGERLLGRRKQCLAFAAALAGEIRIAADDQPLRPDNQTNGDHRHVALLVEQIELQGTALGQRLDRRRPQAGDPIEPGGLQLIVDAGLRE